MHKFRVCSPLKRMPIRYVTLHFRDRGSAASLRYRNRAEITVLMCEQKPYHCLVPRRLSLKRARKGRREGDNGRDGASPVVCTLPMVPCGSSPVTRFALASAMRKTKRLRRRLSLIRHGFRAGGKPGQYSVNKASVPPPTNSPTGKITKVRPRLITCLKLNASSG